MGRKAGDLHEVFIPRNTNSGVIQLSKCFLSSYCVQGIGFLLHIEVTAFQDVPGEQMSTAPQYNRYDIDRTFTFSFICSFLFIHSSVCCG